MQDWERHAHDLVAEAFAEGRPTAWFDRLYAAGRRGDVSMPWDRTEPQPLLVEWVRGHGMTGAGRTAVVVGCGLGQDAEFVAGLGFATTAFDVADTPIRIVRERYPDSPVRYTVANLLDPPADWTHAFDLVVESYTVQALPVELRADAIRNVGRLVAPGGTLLVVAAVREDTEPPGGTPPWPLTRAEIDSFADGGLVTVGVERGDRWVAEFRRP
jgi:SAM-dependent methyltransferase